MYMRFLHIKTALGLGLKRYSSGENLYDLVLHSVLLFSWIVHCTEEDMNVSQRGACYFL